MMDKSTTEYMQGDKVTCPNCGAMEFCIGTDDIWSNGEPYADCTHCLTSTLVRLLKQKYRKNMRDFELDGTEKVTIDLVCETCRKTHVLDRVFKRSIYFGTMHDKIEPEPEDWKCPDHPTSQVAIIMDHQHE